MTDEDHERCGSCGHFRLNHGDRAICPCESATEGQGLYKFKIRPCPCRGWKDPDRESAQRAT